MKYTWKFDLESHPGCDKIQNMIHKSLYRDQLVQANCLKLIKPPIAYIAVLLKLGYSLIHISETKTYTKHN